MSPPEDVLELVGDEGWAVSRGQGTTALRIRVRDGATDELKRRPSVTLEELLEQEPAEDAAELERAWGLTCTGAAVHGRVREAYARARWACREERRALRPVLEAWALAWEWDAEDILEDCRALCGRRTVETWRVHEAGDMAVSLGRARCGNVRCLWCHRADIAPEWRERQRRMAAEHAAEGRSWALVTVTIDPREWCARHGLALTSAAAIVAQRGIGAIWAELVELLERELGGRTEYHRAVELHDSGWPHVHAIATGALVDAMKAEGEERGAAWAELAAEGERARAEQKAARARGERRRAACPTPRTRKRVAALARVAGFGLRFDVSPVADGRAQELVADYLDGPLGLAPDGSDLHDEADDERPGLALAGELAKARQRAGRVLARGVRCWQATARMGLPPRRRATSEGIVRRYVVPVDLETMLRVARASGLHATGGVLRPDFGSPRLERGQRLARELEGAALDGPLGLDALRAWVAAWDGRRWREARTLEDLLEAQEAEGGPSG